MADFLTKELSDPDVEGTQFETQCKKLFIRLYQELANWPETLEVRAKFSLQEICVDLFETH